MPVRIPNTLPASKILQEENIFIMDLNRAEHQDIRPLSICILNLMPNKSVTETQLLRLLGNTPLQIDITLLIMTSHQSKNTAQEHLDVFYSTFEQIKDRKFDGLIITGAPVEKLAFEDVDYWQELKEIFDWSEKNVFSKLYICWAAQAALYHYYGINKQAAEKKVFGVFAHKLFAPKHCLVRGFDDIFYAPHSRHTVICEKDVYAVKDLEVLAASKEAGIFLLADQESRRIFVTGHAEYDPYTLDAEYKRDLDRGLNVEVPLHYYDRKGLPQVRWRSHATLLFSNWLNYSIYQETPYDLRSIKEFSLWDPGIDSEQERLKGMRKEGMQRWRK